MEKIISLNPESVNELQTVFFNKIKSEAKEIGINLDFNNLAFDGYKFRAVLEGEVNSDEATEARRKAAETNLALFDLKLGMKCAVYNRIWSIVDWDDSKYTRNVILKDDLGRMTNVSPEAVTEGIALLDSVGTKRRGRRTKQPAKTEMEAASTKTDTNKRRGPKADQTVPA